MKTKIILQRHGESMANATHVYAGHSDFPLSELGMEQALLAAKALQGERIDAIYSSDLQRAVQTALPHAELHGLKINKSTGLREIYLGEWEAKSSGFLKSNYPYEAVFIWKNYFGLFKAPGGESAPDAGERFCNELLRIARENIGKTVLVTAHAAVIRLSYARLLGCDHHEISAKLPFPTNASFSILYFDGERFFPDKYSLDEHVKDFASEALK